MLNQATDRGSISEETEPGSVYLTSKTGAKTGGSVGGGGGGRWWVGGRGGGVWGARGWGGGGGGAKYVTMRTCRYGNLVRWFWLPSRSVRPPPPSCASISLGG